MKSSLILLAHLFLCIHGHTQKYFEGYVEYDVSYESYMPGVSDNELRERFGAKHRYYVKGNNYLREGRDENGYVLLQNFYIGKEKRIFDLSLFEPDTIYYQNITDTMFLAISFSEGDTEKILDCDCPSVNSEMLMASGAGQDTLLLKLSYFFCNKLPVNPEWYAGYVYWHDIVSRYKSVAIKFIEEYAGLYKITYTAVEIHEEILPDETFRFERNKPMKNVKH